MRKLTWVLLLVSLTFAATRVMGQEEERISIRLGEIEILNLPFTVENFKATNSDIIRVEATSEDILRVIAVGEGTCDLHVSGTDVSIIYHVVVTDNIREIFNAFRKDIDTIPELNVSVNFKRIVVKGEVSSIRNWELLQKVLKAYGDHCLNLAEFRPAPEVLLNLSKSFEKAGFNVVKEPTGQTGDISIQLSGRSLIITGKVINPQSMTTIEHILRTQDWLTFDDGKKAQAESGKVRAVVNVTVAPTLIDVSVVYVGIKDSELDKIGNSLFEKGLTVDATGFVSGEFGKGSPDTGYNIQGSMQATLNALAESGVKRFRYGGHLTFISDGRQKEFSVLHYGGTLKVRVYGGSGGTGTLNDVQYGLILKSRGELISENKVKMDMDLVLSAPELLENNDYDIKETKTKSKVICGLGETIALSGVKQMVENSAGPSGMPFFRKVPILQWVVGTQSNSLENSQVLILISPRIATTAKPLVMPVSEETADTIDKVETPNLRRKEEEGSFWVDWFRFEYWF